MPCLHVCECFHDRMERRRMRFESHQLGGRELQPPSQCPPFHPVERERTTSTEGERGAPGPGGNVVLVPPGTSSDWWRGLGPFPPSRPGNSTVRIQGKGIVSKDDERTKGRGTGRVETCHRIHTSDTIDRAEHSTRRRRPRGKGKGEHGRPREHRWWGSVESMDRDPNTPLYDTRGGKKDGRSSHAWLQTKEVAQKIQSQPTASNARPASYIAFFSGSRRMVYAIWMRLNWDDASSLVCSAVYMSGCHFLAAE